MFTGTVVTYNEAARLPDCLASLSFCKECVVVDLGSSDDSVGVAESFGARVVVHDRVPIVEKIRLEALSQSTNDWVVLLDPDEVFPEAAISPIADLIERNPNLGMIQLPWQFYFLGRPLRNTIWGQNKHKTFVVHKERVDVSSLVYGSFSIKPGFDVSRLTNVPAVKHFWADSVRQLLSKHWRYLQQEGERRYRKGQRFTWRRCLTETGQTASQNLFEYRGYSDLVGIFLSFFYVCYTCGSWLSLRSFQKGFSHESSA